MYVCMYVCIYINIALCMYECIRTHIHVILVGTKAIYIQVHTHAYTHAQDDDTDKILPSVLVDKFFLTYARMYRYICFSYIRTHV